MQYSHILLAAGTLLISLCASAPTVPSGRISFINNTALPIVSTIPESHQKAAAAGIDIYGPIPDDYTHNNGSTYHFLEGSNAAKWARAQLDIKPEEIPQKRWVRGTIIHLEVAMTSPLPNHWLSDGEAAISKH